MTFSAGGGITAKLRGRKPVRAVIDADLDLLAGRMTALVGQSGSGKSTLARVLARLHRQTAGEVLLDGSPVLTRTQHQLTAYCREVQLILQDPFASLNPLHRVRHILTRPLLLHRLARSAGDAGEQAESLLERVNLRPGGQYLDRFPHELSGGERQRVSIARSLAVRPRVLLADEPVSMLDVTIRRDILELLDQLRAEEGLAMLYVTHDLGSAHRHAQDIHVMHHGRIVESGPADQVISDPQDEYTRRLLAAAPDPARRYGPRPQL